MYSKGGEAARSPAAPYLRLGEAERRGQLHPLWRGEIALDLEALLQTGELRVGEDGAGLAAAAVLPGQLGVSVVREQRRHRHSCGDTRRGPGLRPTGAGQQRLCVGFPRAFCPSGYIGVGCLVFFPRLFRFRSLFTSFHYYPLLSLLFKFLLTLFLFCFYFYFPHTLFYSFLSESTPSELSPAGAAQPSPERERSPSEQLKSNEMHPGKTGETGEKPREVRAGGERPQGEKLRPPEEKLWRKRPWEGFRGTDGRGEPPLPRDGPARPRHCWWRWKREARSHSRTIMFSVQI